MKYHQASTDASDIYKPSTAAAGFGQQSTAVIGNVADYMRHATVTRIAMETLQAPTAPRLPRTDEPPTHID